MAEDLGDKTEKATPRKRREARRQANIARSTDLISAMFLTGVVIVLLVFLPALVETWAGVMRFCMSGVRDGGIPTIDSLRTDGLKASAETAAVLAPILLLCCVVAYAANFYQVGWLVTMKPLRPKWSKFNPISGVKRMLGLRAAMKGVLSILKVTFVAIFAVVILHRHFDTVLAMPRMEVGTAVVRAGEIVRELMIYLLFALIILGILDYIYQKWQWEKDQKMSKQQVKEERKNIEGDPHVKQQQRRFAEKILSQRMAAAVPESDVVVANPEHLAIALKWDQGSMSAPIVMAKGADHVALRIRQIAMKHGVPVVERRELARGMYPVVEVGQEIPSAFYAAVAAVLAHVYRLTGKAVK
ncbi:MAG: flagellar biosynthesis protein FlhB [Planctomycetota bacterium]